MESFGDKTRAFLFALLVHLACIALMFVGLLWTQTARPVSVPGPIIEAELIGTGAPKPVRSTPAKPKPAPPKPAPEPPKPEAKPAPPPEPQRNDTVDREKIAEIAQQKAEAQKAQEERQRQEQIRLDDEQQKREAAQRERMKQLDDIKKQREAAEKKSKLLREQLAQLEDYKKQQKPEKPAPADVPESDTRKTGTNGTDASLLGEYSAALINVIKQNWNRPDNALPGLHCTVRVIQLPGGDVMSAQAVAPCNADQATRTSIEEAVTKAQPLPYKGYEKVFSRDLTLNFTYDGN
jgi:colicin import membrane protein